VLFSIGNRVLHRKRTECSRFEETDVRQQTQKQAPTKEKLRWKEKTEYSILSYRIMNPSSDDGEVKLKIGLVGESGVGKSCLLVKWVDDDFFEANDNYTIGVDFKWKSLTVKDQKVKLQIYDTAGQERFRTVTASFYRGAHGIILVYDITNAESYNGKVDEWLREITNYTDADTPIILVGNKVDLEEKRAVDVSTVKKWAAENKMTYIETSAKTGKGIEELFAHVVKLLVTKGERRGSMSQSSRSGGRSSTDSGKTVRLNAVSNASVASTGGSGCC